jgi:hypothetical protein
MRYILAVAIAFAPAVLALEEKETIRKTLTFATGAAERIVEVDVVHGSIRVTGSGRRDVEIEAVKTITADTQTDLADAKRDVKLDITQQDTRVRVYEDGPFRSRDGGVHRRTYYKVRHDLVLKVPKDAVVRLSTVNGGDIRLEQVDGNYDVRNVNGGIEMSELAGSGKITTVNGGIKAAYRKNPSGPVTFKTVNGTVEAQFPKNLAADLTLKTFNGSVYSDFDVEARSVVAQTAGERRNGKFVYRSNRARAARVGKGGPELSFETLNGNIKILQHAKESQ